MKDLLTKYLTLKSELKEMRKELKDELMKESEYAGFYDDLVQTREVLNSYKAKLIQDSPALGAITSKMEHKKAEIKTVKGAISDSIMVVSREDGSQLQLNLRF